MLLRHSFIYVVSNLSTGVFGLATAMMLTRVLTPTSYGVYGLGLGVAVFTSSAFFDWHGTSFLRFVRHHGDRQEAMATFLALFGALAAACACASAMVYATRLAPGYDAVIIVGCVASITTAWFQFTVRAQMADLQPARTFWMNLTRGVITLILSIATALLTESAIYVLLAAAAAQIAGSSIYKLRGLSLNPLKISIPLARAVLRFGYPMAISLTLGGLGLVVSRFMLDHLASTEAVGRFTAANFAIQNTLNMIAGGIGAASYPLSLKAIESGDPAALNRQLVHNFALLLGVLLPGAVGLSLTSPNLAPLLVGHDFVDAVIALTPWLAAAAVMSGIRGYYFDYAFQFGRKTGYLAFIVATVAVLNIGFNLLLIPWYGERGAAMAQAFALAPSLVLAVVLSPRAFPVPLPLKVTAQAIFASLSMAAAVVALGDLHGLTGLIVQTTVGVAVYSAALIVVDYMGVRSRMPELIKAGIKLAVERIEIGSAKRAAHPPSAPPNGVIDRAAPRASRWQDEGWFSGGLAKRGWSQSMSMKSVAKRLALAAAYKTGLHRLASTRFAGAGVIFTAHRIVEPGEAVIDPSQAITTCFLSQCLEHVQDRGYQIVSLDQVHERLAGPARGPGFVCFTFDDGYRDNLTLGLPIFERHGAPMNVYVVTGFPDRQLLYWWRGLEHLVLQREALEVRVGSRTRHLRMRTIAEKRAAYSELVGLVQDRPDIAQALLLRYGIDTHRLLREDTLSWAELATLARHPLVTIGAHGVTHAGLSSLDPRSAREEMENSKTRLEAMLGKPIHHFAFPFGACGEREYALARELGFRTATTSVVCNVFHDQTRGRWSLPRVPLDSTVERRSIIDLHLSGMTAAFTMRLRHPAIIRRPARSGGSYPLQGSL